MSVRSSERGEGKLKVLVEAQGLAAYTMQICKNEKVFLPEYRSSITDDIVHTANQIFIDLWTANNIYVKTKADRAERRRLQESAANGCNNLLALMQIAHKVFHLKTKRIKYWGGRTIEVRNLIRAWRDSDSRRYAGL